MNKDKDPILFGLPAPKSEKMYFIASWEDKWCDYTLSRLLDDMTSKFAGNIKFNQADIPTTVDELVDAIDSTTGVWKQYSIGVEDMHDRIRTITIGGDNITTSPTSYHTLQWFDARDLD